MKTLLGTDVVLATPPTTEQKEFGLLAGGGANRPPLNLLNLAAVLLENGVTVEIIDGATVSESIADTAERILSCKPRYVGLTAMTAHVHACGALAREIRRHSDIPIILGGIHFTTYPERTMSEFPWFDFGVVGEGEITCLELIKTLESGGDVSEIRGLAIRTENGVQVNPPRPLIQNLDSLPLPAWHLLPDYVQTYQPTLSRKTRLPSAYIVTSRGCPYLCSFCSNVVHGHTFRSYSVDYLMKMVSYMVEHYQVKDLTLYDENLALNRKRITEFCERLIEARYDLTWSCDARADSVDEDILALMYQAGCRSIWFGMESGNPEILKRYNKKTTLEVLEKAARLTRQNKIKACGSFIIGGPGETTRTIKDTIRFAKRIKLDFFVPFYYTPIPGAPEYDTISQQGTVDLDFKSATMTQPTFAPHGMTFNDIQVWYVRALLSFYLQPRIILSRIKEMGFGEIWRSGTVFVASVLKFMMHRDGRTASSAE